MRLNFSTIRLDAAKTSITKGTFSLKSWAGSNRWKNFNEWSTDNHRDTWTEIRLIQEVWKAHSKSVVPYCAYAEIDSKKAFKWKIIPYQKCNTWFGRVTQQIRVLWQTLFKGKRVPVERRAQQMEEYEAGIEKIPKNFFLYPPPFTHLEKGDDPFCQDNIYKSQQVFPLTPEANMRVLFNYAPIGFGGERLHFLITPKAHRKTFENLTQFEYVKAMELVKMLHDHFTKTRDKVEKVYLIHKNGKDAGQTVEHWHLHVIFSLSRQQSFWGKWTVFKNIIFGSSPMKTKALEKRVVELRRELNPDLLT